MSYSKADHPTVATVGGQKITIAPGKEYLFKRALIGAAIKELMWRCGTCGHECDVVEMKAHIIDIHAGGEATVVEAT